MIAKVMEEFRMRKKKITLSKSKPETIREAFREFIGSKKRSKCSPATIEFYETIPVILGKFKSLDSPITDLTEEFTDAYCLWLTERDTAEASVVTYVRNFRVFAYWCMSEGYIEQFKIKLPKSTETFKQIYTDDELKRLMVKPKKNCSFATYRTWVFINYVLGTGQRLSTVLSIQNGDVDLENKLVYLRHMKNRKQTILPLPDFLIDVLFEYRKIRGGEISENLFCTEYGEPITTSGMKTAVKRYNRSRGVEKTSIHLFRHTFAVHWVRENGDIAKLQRILCHSDLRVTQQYLDLTCDDLRHDMSKMNPLEKIKQSRKIQL